MFSAFYRGPNPQWLTDHLPLRLPPLALESHMTAVTRASLRSRFGVLATHFRLPFRNQVEQAKEKSGKNRLSPQK